jgi:Fe-S cluster biosynthesis and repair protein YggX
VERMVFCQKLQRELPGLDAPALARRARPAHL